MSDLPGLDDAAAAALWSLRNAPKESIGLIYGDDYARTRPVSRENSGKVRASFQIPAGSLRALFHNHPADKRIRQMDREKFSTDDLNQAIRARVPSYISAGDKIMRYDPHTGSAEEVLAQIPIMEMVAELPAIRSERK